jgi:hypothetical protein
LAALAPPQHFDLPAGDAATALRLAAQQAGREIMFPAAIVQGVVAAGAFAPKSVWVSDAHAGVAEALGKAAGVRVASNNADVVAAADTLVLCVKPGDALGALKGLKLKGVCALPQVRSNRVS